MNNGLKGWWQSGAPWIWLNAGAVSASLVMVVGLLGLIAFNGLGHFWPHPVWAFDYQASSGAVQHLVGEITDQEQVLAERMRHAGDVLPEDLGEYIDRYLLKTGNRDVSGLDFRWILEPLIVAQDEPEQLAVLERTEWGNFYGFLDNIKQDGKVVAEGEAAWHDLLSRLEFVQQVRDQIRHIEKVDIGGVNHSIEHLRLEQRELELTGEDTPERLADLQRRRDELQAEFVKLQKELEGRYQQISGDSATMTVMGGRQVEVPLAKIVRAYRPNAMNLWQKIGFYVAKVWEFVSDDPREANTEGGIFPAIFGTVVMVLLMSVVVTPFGVVAAVYLREYARQGPLTRLIRIAVNNLAGVPSIVYGVFGLGFFVYFLGGNIDQLFYPEALPAPTFGTPGLMWASLTLALLTLPVVIVATEEGLTRVPSAIREGSLALGATKAETLWRTVLPMASPAMMTGLILAVARAAGEVAPLMLVGVVKLAPSLPVDGTPPFVHLDRKFMHLGFHIYDVGFQSPNVEAARPLVYATALLLVLVILILNLAAISLRNRLRERYRELEQ